MNPIEARAPLVELLSQGDEILRGQTVDTNSAELSRAMVGLGLDVRRHASAGDDPDDIAALLREASTRAVEVVCTGGLGPTSDDWTAEAAGRAFGLPLAEHPLALEQIRDFFKRFGRELDDSNRRQARIPLGARPLANPAGTAPGFVLEIPREDAPACRLWFLPGVPREMREMYALHLLPALVERWPALRPERLVTLRCVGRPESGIGDALRNMEREGLRVGFRAMTAEVQVKLRFAASFPLEEQARLVEEARERCGAACFGVDSGPLEEVLVSRLIASGQTVATAESCTAGRLAAALTSISGSSACFLEGAVVYSNEAKVRTCEVPRSMLEQHGAVSEPVAIALAEGIRRRAGTSWGLSTTGVAGPTGGTPEKPVGTVHIAVAGPHRTQHRALRLLGDRHEVMSRAVAFVLDLLRRELDAV